jgi:hypothetical protein
MRLEHFARLLQHTDRAIRELAIGSSTRLSSPEPTDAERWAVDHGLLARAWKWEETYPMFEQMRADGAWRLGVQADFQIWFGGMFRDGSVLFFMEDRWHLAELLNLEEMGTDHAIWYAPGLDILLDPT